MLNDGTNTSGPSKIIKSAGKILTLTADDAVAYGLAAGMAKNVSAVRDAMGLRAWHVADEGVAWKLVADRARSAEAGFDEHLTKPVSSKGLEAVLLRAAR